MFIVTEYAALTHFNKILYSRKVFEIIKNKFKNSSRTYYVHEWSLK